MKNLGQLMKQAQEMQSRMAEMQERLQDSEVVGQAGGGMVQITMNGKHEVRAVKIDPNLITPDEAEVLEDLIAAAVNDARVKIEAFMQEERSEERRVGKECRDQWGAKYAQKIDM